MKQLSKWICLILLSTGVISCNKNFSEPFFLTATDFSMGGSPNWSAGFSDYSTATDTAIFSFRKGLSKLPAPLDTTKQGFRLQSINRSDDIFMYLTQKVSGLAPNTKFNVEFVVELASNAPDKSVGIGGSPAHSVYLKAGASGVAPAVTLVGDFYTFNLDKGNQAQGGKDLMVLGDISNGTQDSTYKFITRSNENQKLQVTSNADGNIYVVVGTDSGYEGLTNLYYKRIQTRFTPATN
ncbi:hypothetical protein BWI96_17595 [Siphonobacter sp. SORGH_AS_0500]|uniref:hypothetical protein n=1 Tax=Siphonobacter sp. SORGH_AS_0500 TaxID=1864824 RepID=UPI000CC2554D|nr:hypothetical protein [Siphonobacter sp. SORGH_AS_0500]PKK35340.1 hypothetical protein BWI96_17595 [Siphonobacter sp. SORGH_AS_0500]